jgi:hypothetical protein
MMAGAADAMDAMARLLHVALRHCRARIEIFDNQCFQNIGTLFEKPFADSFQECQNLGVTQRLVGIFDSIGPS